MNHGEENRIRVSVMRIGHRAKLLLNERLIPYHITAQQARIIGFVTFEQRQGKTIYQKDIEEAFDLKGSSITSLLQGLERKGFIQRRPDPANESRKIVTILPKGQELMSEFETAFQEMNEKMMRGLTHEQREALVEILTHMERNLEQ